MEQTASALELPTNRMSFTATISLIRAYAPLFAAAKTTDEHQRLVERFRTNMNQTKLPNRSKDRSYPRVIKLPRDKYPCAGIVRKCQDGEK